MTADGQVVVIAGTGVRVVKGFGQDSHGEVYVMPLPGPGGRGMTLGPALAEQTADQLGL